MPLEWEVSGAQQPLPQAKSVARGAAASGKSQFASFTLAPIGWEIQPVQPPHPSPEKRSAAIARVDRGAFGTSIIFQKPGWEVQSWQPPHRQTERSGAIQIGDGGTQAKFVFTAVPVAFGYDGPVHYKRTFSRVSATKGRAHFAIYATYLPYGWEVAPPVTIGSRSRFAGAIAVSDGGHQGPLTRWFNAGWETRSVQPSHPRPERSAAGLHGDDGTEAKFIFQAAPVVWWEAQLPLFARQRVQASGLAGQNQFASFTLAPIGWEIQPIQPPHPRPERSGSWLRGSDGTEGKFVFQAAPIFWWEAHQPQPPHPRPERFGAAVPRADGIEPRYAVWKNTGWEVQPVQPPHPRPERSAAVLRGDEGNEGKFTFQAAPVVWWEVDQSQPPHPRPERWGAFAPREDGTELPFTRWFNGGWDATLPDLPRFRWEREGAFAGLIFDRPVLPVISWFDSALLSPRKPSRLYPGVALLEHRFFIPPPPVPLGVWAWEATLHNGRFWARRSAALLPANDLWAIRTFAQVLRARSAVRQFKVRTLLASGKVKREVP